MTDSPVEPAAVEELPPVVSAQEQARIEARVQDLVRADDERKARASAPKTQSYWRAQVEKLLASDRADGGGWADPQDAQDWDDPRAYQQQVRTRAWHSGLRAAYHDRYIDADLNLLDDDQHGQTFAYFIDQLGDDAKRCTLIAEGSIGGGKTHASIAAGNRAAARGMFVRFVQHTTYLTWLRPDGAPAGLTADQVRERHRTCDLLILDDLGAEMEQHASEHVRKETQALVGDRVAARRPMIVTTNLDRLRLTEVLGERLTSRLYDARIMHKVMFVGADRRA